ncbi:MAG: 3-mercaptopyruvate sulfurtransferase [Brevundimonas sp.]|uniref:3-mercaptopyruvate sulfurtransferase n=1 Tax=Brevundimonas sp. TaxID=1871086 RepID=UPI0018376D8E|nr:3-mercaptopyruvate sulfurtransferase [Brevundimonas sp.]MBA4803163.1 3-mercaptopyruvate sulfurtransferase [Brevundimonas sp.]
MSDSPLISAADLVARLGDPGLRPVDASWSLDGRDCRPDFEAARLPGAVFLDLDASSDTASPLPHMLPPPEAFAARMGSLGVSDDALIVVYDSVGLWSAPRAWWMLRAMGALRVRVLDGGLPAWRAAGLPLDSGPAAAPRPATFHARPDPSAIASMEDVRRALAGDGQVLDVRPAARFRGEAAEPRPGLRGGHMPGALNLPFADLLTPEGRLRPPGELRAAFAAAGLDPERPVTTSCGSGVTAAIAGLALAALGRPFRLYDGSWAEWGAPDGGPVATGR